MFRNLHNGSFEKFSDILILKNESKENLKQNLNQFKEDIKWTYQQKIQWVQDYFIENPGETVVNSMTKMYFSIRMMWMKNIPLVPEDGNTRILFVFKDITDKENAKTCLMADNMKSAIINTISHELHTRLNGLLCVLYVI